MLQCPAPDPQKIPKDDLLGVTVLLLTCLYREREFIRVGYYVSNYYMEAELNEFPPDVPQPDKILRQVLTDKARITRFDIDWS